jgi:coenzyme F420-reducing hydrogenase beta subunit
MIENINKVLCTGCDACLNICSENCIEMIIDEYGFRYPKVNNNKCTKCKECINICPSLTKPSFLNKWTDPKIFAAWSLDANIRFTSTSGGVFSELAEAVINENGYIVGAIYNEQHLVEHYITNIVDDIRLIKQSKYLQSNIGTIFRDIKEKLDSGYSVSICGSPCQIAGLNNYLKKDYANLITIDFVCRGANSPKAYIKYIEMLENQFKNKIDRVWFKNKTYGWNRFSTRIDFKNGKTYLKDRFHDMYMRGYIEENLYMRPCCFECKYKSFPRIADLTLGDFWGVGFVDPQLDTDQGTSLVMVNSVKGGELYSKIINNLYSKELEIDNALRGNLAISKSAIKNDNSYRFLIDLDNNSFNKCFRKYAKNTGIKRLIVNNKRIINKSKHILKVMFTRNKKAGK